VKVSEQELELGVGLIDKLTAYSRNSMEIVEEEEEHSTEIVSQQQEQLSWVQVQLAVAEEECGRLREEWHCIENQIKNRHSPC
jgi:hypothetical protein